MNDYYILDNKTVKKIQDVQTWASWYETADKRVKLDCIGNCKISTIFLGRNYRWFDNGRPLLFETVVFGGKLNQNQWRCSTWNEAIIQHEAVCEKVQFLEEEKISSG